MMSLSLNLRQKFCAVISEIFLRRTHIQSRQSYLIYLVFVSMLSSMPRSPMIPFNVASHRFTDGGICILAMSALMRTLPFHKFELCKLVQAFSCFLSFSIPCVHLHNKLLAVHKQGRNRLTPTKVNEKLF